MLGQGRLTMEQGGTGLPLAHYLSGLLCLGLLFCRAMSQPFFGMKFFLAREKISYHLLTLERIQ